MKIKLFYKAGIGAFATLEDEVNEWIAGAERRGEEILSLQTSIASHDNTFRTVVTVQYQKIPVGI